MFISIIIPTYKTPKMIAFAVAQLLKYSGSHILQIFIVDNNAGGDDTVKYLKPFVHDIVYIPYPKNKLQSHGIGTDYCISLSYDIMSDYFITLESDSYPTKDNWIDYYIDIIDKGYDAAGSVLKLSGGTYLHGCGAIYKKEIWKEAKGFCDNIPYRYFPNMIRKEGFDCHAMIHNSIVDEVLSNPNDWVELSTAYMGLTKDQMRAKTDYYSVTNNPFHNGMGGLDESVNTSGLRCVENDSPTILLNNARKIIRRIGYEPSQFLHYYMAAKGLRIFEIPTEVKWLPNREGQQQEYTLNEAGIFHCWGVSSYTERSAEGVEDIYEAKNKLPEDLYEMLPEHQKIKI